MSEEAIKEYIDDNVRLATDSSNRASMEMMRSMQISMQAIQTQMREHHEQELESREIYRERMLMAVKEQVQTTVNGKIDKIDKKLDFHIADVAPIVKEYKESQQGHTYLKKKVTVVAWVAGSLVTIAGGLAVVKLFLTKLW